MVGSINIQPLTEDRAEIGYWIGKQYVGNRYATTALKMLSDFSLTSLCYRKIETHIAVGNEGSRKTTENAGYSYVETRPMIDPSGALRDYWIFSMTKNRADKDLDVKSD
jgi:RimJ/RimL family protein N-acetyltransferase